MVDCHFSYITEMREKNSPAFKFGNIQLESISFWPHWYQWHQQHLELDVSPTVLILKWWTLTCHTHLPQTMDVWSKLYIIWSMWLSQFGSFLTSLGIQVTNWMQNACKNSLAHVVNNGRLHNLPWIVMTFTSIFMSLMDKAHFMFQSSCVFDF
jgi:hypothetical protein